MARLAPVTVVRRSSPASLAAAPSFHCGEGLPWRGLGNEAQAGLPEVCLFLRHVAGRNGFYPAHPGDQVIEVRHRLSRVGKRGLEIGGPFDDQGDVRGFHVLAGQRHDGLPDGVVVLRHDKIVDAKTDHRPSQARLHGNVGIHLGELRGVDAVDVHEQPGVQRRGVREEHDPALVEIHAKDLPVGSGGLLDKTLRVAAHVAQGRPHFPLDVALPDPIRIGNHQHAVRREGDAFRARENAVAKRAKGVAAQVEYEDLLCRLGGYIEPVIMHGNAGGAADSGNGLDEVAVQIIAHDPRIAPIRDPQVSPPVERQVLRSDEPAVRPAGPAEGRDCVARRSALRDAVGPVLRDEESAVIGFRHVIGMVQAGKPAVNHLEKLEIRVELQDLVRPERDHPEAAIGPRAHAGGPLEGVAALERSVQGGRDDPLLLRVDFPAKAAPQLDDGDPVAKERSPNAGCDKRVPGPDCFLLEAGFPKGTAQPFLGQGVRALVADCLLKRDNGVAVEAAVEGLDASPKLFGGMHCVEIEGLR